MTSSKKSILNSNLTYVIAFVLPLIMMAALYYTREIFPWGSDCYLRSDMYHQYAPFFSELWHKIRNGESLLLMGYRMGTNFTSCSHITLQPSNWFVALSTEIHYRDTECIYNTMIAGSSLSLTYYLTISNNKHVIAAIFGMFYGMSGFIAAYSWNIMWLDCVILIPLHAWT
ncbi:MAG: YfhO family protein [Lachnospira eligens]